MHTIGDVVELELRDPGGVWEAHNKWLIALGSEVCLESDVGTIRLTKTDFSLVTNAGQWTARPKPLEIAKSHGHTGGLSGENPALVQAKITRCP